MHAFKNTLLPVITVFGVQLGIMFAFTILTETVFQWQGMGFMFLEAVERSDTSLLVAYLVVVGVIFVVVNTVVDIIYGLVNPTVRIAGAQMKSVWQRFKQSYFSTASGGTAWP